MIASLEGKLESLGSDWIVVNVGGIGFQVFIPTTTLSQLGSVGSDIKLYTHLHMREDNVTLYGFPSNSDLGLFTTLLNVSGLGPRMALSILSAMDTKQIVMAIASGNVNLLTDIPGIGKKMASRLVLELKDKIGAGLVTAEVAELTQKDADVLAALTFLGYSTGESTRALASIPHDQQFNLEEKIKLALAYLRKQ
ncbi:MAG: Holliday junction branch migration protein RuvA [Dehalococcoidia bacterium]|nr:MAG: Holliday junction branch migration protein RuvA [Dehalococcoidia bacterium]